MITNILNKLDKPYSNRLTVDLEGITKKQINKLVKNLKDYYGQEIKDIILERNTNRYKHYHLIVYFSRIITYAEHILLRLMLYDDPDRLRFDLLRFEKDYDDFANFVANHKYQLVLAVENGKINVTDIKQLSRYKPVKV